MAKEADKAAVKAEPVVTEGRFPLVPLRDQVAFPSMVIPVNVARPMSMKAIDVAMVNHGRRIVLVVQRDAAVEEPSPKDLYDIGCIAEVYKVLKSTEKSLRVIVEGLSRIRITKFNFQDGYYEVETEAMDEAGPIDSKTEAMWRTVQKQFEEYSRLSRRVPQELVQSMINLDDAVRFSFMAASYIPLKVEDRQHVLSIERTHARLTHLSLLLAKELEILELERKIQSRVRKQMEKTQKEWYLSEQLKAIQKELGQKDEIEEEIAEFRKRVKDAKMPEEVEAKALKELERLGKMAPVAAEATVIRTYLDWLVSMPWSLKTEDNLDLKRAAAILDEDHYGLEKIKERVVEFMAVRRLQEKQEKQKNAKHKSPILCFVGPPGVGKTSLAQSIARSMGRKFVRVSLGGVRDEAEIRGHRRTYIGALPGKIIQGLRKAGTKNPVFLLDEVDKMSMDFRGDPSAALLEVLDPEQNVAFNDHYLEADFDLSEVMFITTANVLYGIPWPLQDRLEILRLPGYLDQEKEQIARMFIIPKQVKEHGLAPGSLKIAGPALKTIMSEYTREAGVRSLERQIKTICRKVAREIVEHRGKARRVAVTKAGISRYLGVPQYPAGEKLGKDEAGVATGLAWTEFGGEILSIEVALLKGRGNVTLTGKLGDVMRESAQAAISYARSRAESLGISPDFNRRYDIHIHVPEGATPKDGPSAGITMAVALVSALTGRPVYRKTAMTGEITLRGNVLPIGGVKEKLLAAYRMGCHAVLLPAANEKDLEEVPKSLRRGMRIVVVKHMDEVLQRTLHPKVRPPRANRPPIPRGKRPEARPEPRALA